MRENSAVATQACPGHALGYSQARTTLSSTDFLRLCPFKFSAESQSVINWYNRLAQRARASWVNRQRNNFYSIMDFTNIYRSRYSLSQVISLHKRIYWNREAPAPKMPCMSCMLGSRGSPQPCDDTLQSVMSCPLCARLNPCGALCGFRCMCAGCGAYLRMRLSFAN